MQQFKMNFARISGILVGRLKLKFLWLYYEVTVTFPGEAAQADGEAHGHGEEGEEDEVDGVPLPEEHHGQHHCRVETRVKVNEHEWIYISAYLGARCSRMMGATMMATKAATAAGVRAAKNRRIASTK